MNVSMSAKADRAADLIVCDAEVYKNEYSEEKFLDKLGRVARRIGSKAVFPLLVLFYSTLDKSIPIKTRVTVLAALGYFICPLDILPDALPVLGFTDDMAAVTFVLRQIWNNLNRDTVDKARRQLRRWFPDAEPETLVTEKIEAAG